MNENESHLKKKIFESNSKNQHNNHDQRFYHCNQNNNIPMKLDKRNINKFEKKDKKLSQEIILKYDKNNVGSQMSDLKNCYSEHEKNKTNSNQTNSNDSDNYKKYFNKTTSSQLITTTNSIHVNSFENNSKTNLIPTKKNCFLIANNEINIDLESINVNTESSYANVKNGNVEMKKSEIENSNSLNNLVEGNYQKVFFTNCRIDQPIKIDFLNKKRKEEHLLDKNDFSKIKSDLCPDTNYQGYRIEKHSVSKFSDGFFNIFNNQVNKKINNKHEIIEDLRFKLLKYNLEKKRTHNISEIEKIISKEIFFHQLFRLYTSKDNKMIKSFIIKMINEVIGEDNILENLLLLSKFQVFKDSSVNKRKLQKKNLVRLIEMITSNNLMHPNLNEFFDSDSSILEEESKSSKDNFLKGSKIDLVRESLDKFVEFLDSNGFQILRNSTRTLIKNKKKMNKYKRLSLKNIKDTKIRKMRVLKFSTIKKKDSSTYKNDKMNCENKFKCNIAEDHINVNNIISNFALDNVTNNKDNVFINKYNNEINASYNNDNINGELFYTNQDVKSNMIKSNDTKNNNNFYFINVVNNNDPKDLNDYYNNLRTDNILFQNKTRKTNQTEAYKPSSEKNSENIESLNSKVNQTYGKVAIKCSNIQDNKNFLLMDNKDSNKNKHNSSKVRRAWLCSHIDKLNYARGKCQNCYSNFYHKKPNCNIFTKI